MTSCVRNLSASDIKPGVVDAFLRTGPEMIAYFEAHTHLKFTYAVGRPDYRPDAPGAAHDGRTTHPLPFDARQLGGHVKRLRPPLADMTLQNSHSEFSFETN